MYEKNSEKYYKLENFRFFPSTEITKIDTFPAIEGLSFFEFLVDSGTNYKTAVYAGKPFLVGEYNYNNEVYSLEYKLIPNKSGLFYIEQGVSPQLGGIQDFEGYCSNLAEPGGVVNMNNGSDNNVNMLSYSPDPHYSDWVLQKPEQRFHENGGFCFYVKE